MSDADDEPVLITPPPGVALPTQATPAAETDPAAPQPASPEDFITLPPGVLDSGTYRVANPRVVPSKSARHDDDIVFFPTAPGMPAPAAASVTPVVEAAGDPEATRVGVARHASLQWRLVLPDGVGAKAVDGALFLGRNPARTAERPDAELLTLIDPAKSLSKTHALLEVDSGVLWVHDLDSTNGVFIVQANGDAVEVEPGTRASVPAGSELEFGDYVIRVERS